MAACMTTLHHSLLALEPQHGPSFSLAYSFRLLEAAAVVASGGDAGDEFRPAAASMRARRRAGRDVWRGWLVHQSVAVLLTPSTLPVDVGYSLSESICDLRTTTRAPYVSAAPVRCRKVVYPGGCTARPGSWSCTAVGNANRAAYSQATGVKSLCNKPRFF